MKTTVLILLPMLAACAGMDIDGARVGLVGSDLHARNTTDLGEGETVTERARGDGFGVRAELVNVVAPDLQASFSFGYGEDDVADVGLRNYDVGAAFRYYVTETALRPYAEVRAGYRYAEALTLWGDGGHLDMLTAGGALGAELGVSSGLALFAQVGYEGAFADGYTQQGPCATIGLAIRF